MMTSAEIRQSFLDFFRTKQHTLVPSSSLLPASPNLLFTNAGMNQFVPIFLGERPPDVSQWAGAVPGLNTRAADTQKCIRAGGKHNDLEDVGLDTYHHTFFEMLGNWSFGDYFKAEAIEWAWELVVTIWGFPPARLYATVYQPGPGDPAAFDSEAHAHWSRLFTAVGLDPAVHVRSGGKQDNFWMMGETGPCGPCSELHVDLTPAGDTRGHLVNGGDARCIEIWNLVFIQFNANADGSFAPLPARHVDTGMGFERVAGIVQGTRGFTDFSRPISNYETDVFRPIFAALEGLSGRHYGSSLPGPDSTGQIVPANDAERVDVAFRVIADHIRTLSFAIADGIEPGNGERNYVLRRILRRAVRYGRTLGFHEPFFFKLAEVVAASFGDVFPEVRSRQAHIAEVLLREERAFNETLDRGLKLFEEEIGALERLGSSDGEAMESVLSARMVLPAERLLTDEVRREARRQRRLEQARLRCFPGEAAFVLYDTYGFPEDLTRLLARERGFGADPAGYAAFMEEQKRLARESRVTQVIELSQVETKEPTRFVGFDELTTFGRVVEVVRIKDRTGVIVDRSSCYAEMGVQVGDSGEMSAGPNCWRVVGTQKSGPAWLHWIEGDDAPGVGTEVRLAVDAPRRAAIQRHHTVTHLLHWALHEIVGRAVSQKGSFVGPDKLTFDFNSAPLSPSQVADVERLVNERILENAGVSWIEVPYREVQSRADIMQFFGDKYGDQVRVVQIGGRPRALDGFSMELCGGTHCRATGEIGLFRVTGENAIAAGIRRIEATAGLEAYNRTRDEASLLHALAGRMNAPVADLDRKLENLLAEQKEFERHLRAMARKQAAAKARELVAQRREASGIPLIVANVGAADAEVLQEIVNELKGHFTGVVFLAGIDAGNVVLVASVSPEFTGRVQAGRIMQRVAPVVGGRGGGRPDNARGGGKDAGRVEEALGMVERLLEPTKAA
jgi:alanyl-tRNA synthetase